MKISELSGIGSAENMSRCGVFSWMDWQGTYLNGLYPNQIFEGGDRMSRYIRKEFRCQQCGEKRRKFQTFGASVCSMECAKKHTKICRDAGWIE